MASGELGIQKDAPLRIAQYSDQDFKIYAYDVDVDENRYVVGRSRMDLTGATVVVKVKDSADVIVIYKNSSLASQIEINADQVTLSTKGTAILKLVGADTSGLTVGAKYYYDIWVHTAGGKAKRIVKKSSFYVDDGVYEPSVGAPPATPGDPATQTQQERSFIWTVPSNGLTFTVTTPGSGMVDAGYMVLYSRQNIALAGFPELRFPDAAQTSTTFEVVSDVALAAGDTFAFLLRDV